MINLIYAKYYLVNKYLFNIDCIKIDIFIFFSIIINKINNNNNNHKNKLNI